MLAYRPDQSIVHRLDARTKLAVQLAFAVAATVNTTPWGLVAMSGIAGAILLASRTPPIETLRTFRFAILLLLIAPIVEGATLGYPWFHPGRSASTAMASYRVLLIILVGAAYIRTTPVRESQAAIQWFVPGRAGRFLGVGIGFVARFIPLLRSDVERLRAASWIRLGSERPVHDRMTLLALGGADRALERADRFADALRARCFSWNPTLPPLRFSRVDVLGFVLTLGLLSFAIAGALA